MLEVVTHLKVRSKLQLVNAFKDLAQEGLHPQGVLGFAQDLQQLVIGEEVEAGESQPLCFQVIIQTLLDLHSFQKVQAQQTLSANGILLYT